MAGKEGILSRTVRLGLSERGEEVSHLGKIFQAKGSASAKILR